MRALAGQRRTCRVVQMKLHQAGLYFGDIDGAYSSEPAAALGRYQIRNGLPITGQLDTETTKSLDAKPAVATTAADRTRSSETWRRLRMSKQQTPNNAQETSSSRTAGTPGSGAEMPAPSPPVATTPLFSESAEPASAPPATASDTRFFVARVQHRTLARLCRCICARRPGSAYRLGSGVLCRSRPVL